MLKQKKKSGTLEAQIIKGCSKMMLFSCIFGILILAFLYVLNKDYRIISDLQQQRFQIQSTITAHYSWRANLGISLQTSRSFTGSLDSNTCSFGKWINENSGPSTDPKVSELILAAKGPHDQIHTIAAELVELGAANPNGAYNRFVEELSPLTDEVIKHLNDLDVYYNQQISKAQREFEWLLIGIIVLTILVTLLIVIFSLMYSKKLARSISRPIMRVVEWANRLALGAENLDVDEDFMKLYEENRDNEIGTMIQSFQDMATNIQENVEVLKRVANGDMTAFVNIRSHRDSLGKSLYRLVQSNDALFNEIVEAAHTVAAGAGEIANASHSLAESATAQASAVHNLSSTVQHASDLIHENNEQAKNASKITEAIKEETKTSNEHMKMLIDAVNQIHDASQRISVVMKSIDDIAFETNILALNAAIEAARAGAAGKGFAVVADEVRALALKSADAAKESKMLIENSIQQTQKGSEIAQESAAIFATMNEEIDKIVQIVEQSAALSAEQLEGINMVNREIAEISDSATSNAAISEESAASSHEMSQQAEILKKAMQRFNLRKRTEGMAYIPSEKQGDEDFIKAANEAYKHKERTGHFGHEYIDPAGQQMESAIFGNFQDPIS